MDEEKLVQLIKEKLIARETAKTVFSYQHYGQINASPDSSIFKNYRRVEFNGVSIQLMNDLYRCEKTPWIDWILTGISYQTVFYFEINQFILPFIPWKMLTGWPINFIISTCEVHAFQESMITRSMIVGLLESSYLVKLNHQKITGEALELIKRKKIQVIERSNQSCIWEK
ncbi:PduM family microcompartment protein [Vagococcus hydrophili]|uniref:PduM family microcompartment protein n=1 Tax=Vagococcus hydrophili TaxID=2714947 RepID=A0A6G8AQB3_9ENTE|nr:PduM family microcompartment protein [Vagococcus hydrophili]QIL47159.1 PduM family microcompartment protein [Vagococcus hydrophili]